MESQWLEKCCKKANKKFLANGIILREMLAYQLPQCLRLTIGKEEENLKLLALLQEIDAFARAADPRAAAEAIIAEIAGVIH